MIASANALPLIVLAGVALWLTPAILVALHARDKGYSLGVFLLLGLVTSWIVSLIVALLVHDNRTPTPVAAVQAAPSTHPDLDRLGKLAELHAAGALTDAEFAAEKSKLLDG